MDEDVELEGSVLDDYFKKISKSILQESSEAEPVTAKDNAKSLSPFRFILHKINYCKGMILTFLCGREYTILGQKNEKSQRRYHRPFVQKIVDSGILIQEDSEYLTPCHPNLLSREEKTQSRSKYNESSLLLHFVVVIFAIVLAFTKFSLVCINLAAVAGALSICKVVTSKITDIKLMRNRTQMMRALEIFLKSNSAFQTLVHKCLRFIQDVEIAAMGYTLISGNTPVNRLERTRQRHVRECIQLRQQVLKSFVNLIMEYRDASLKITRTQDQCENFKFSFSLCQIPIEELGPCFDKAKSFEEMVAETDGFCLEVLRDTSHFLHRQRSELLKLMCLMPFENGVGSDLSRTLDTLCELCDAESKKLLIVFKAHQNVQGEMKSASQSLQQTAPSLKTPLYNAVHSAQIHLRAALHVAIQAEECVEGYPDNQLLEGFLLPQLKIHLDASTQCVEESLKCLHPKIDPADHPAEVRLPIVKNPVGTELNGEVKLDECLLDSTENFSEDQIFEAVVDEQNGSLVQNCNEEIEEFQTNRKKRIEETKHVMNELQSVLHIKTSAEEREIRKSRLFPNYTPKLVQPQPSCTVSVTEKNETTEKIPDSNERIKHAECLKRDFVGDGGLLSTHKMLKLPRRPTVPGRRRRKRMSKGQSWGSNQGDTDEVSDPDVSGDDEKSVPLSFGFPSVLASQAARAAFSTATVQDGYEMGSRLAGAEETFGDSDSGS